MEQIKSLIWDKENREHIEKHGVSEDEVEELCSGRYKSQPTYKDRFLILGRIKSGRALTAVLAHKAEGEYYVVTARDMSKKERRRFL